jgi:hypothetical protein
MGILAWPTGASRRRVRAETVTALHENAIDIDFEVERLAQTADLVEFIYLYRL